MDKTSNKIERSALSYQDQGFTVLKNFVNEVLRVKLLSVVEKFHHLWCQDNAEFYQSHAINSADLTATNYLNDADRQSLFNFVSSHQLHQYLEVIFPNPYGFMNTQLFFDPVNPKRKNYWHRDPQWHLSLEQQKASLATDNVIHCRIALLDERGIELLPGSHKNWDSKIELDTRLSQNGQLPHQDLPAGKSVALEAGDLLIFSGNMIHRGLYGQNRMALDLLFCDAKEHLMKWVNPDCLPSATILAQLERPEIFEHCRQFAARAE